MVDLSIIIINFNTARLTRQCLESIRNYTRGITYEIILIDNASSETQSKMLLKNAAKYKNVTHIIKNSENIGFAGGNNEGLRVANGRYILLLNSDTLISTDVLTGIVKWMDENEQVGISSCSLRNVDGSMQRNGGYFPSLLRVFFWMSFLDDLPFINRITKPFHNRRSNFMDVIEQDWVTGAFFLIRSDVLREIGLLDQKYFMYVEDVDYCFRAKKSGWKIMNNSSFSIIHYGGSSSRKEYPIISEFKSLKIFYRKYYSSVALVTLRVMLKIGCLLRMGVLGILEGKESFKVYAKAFTQI